jgi:predicted DsbA family dithiol-disulfide isomerase
MRGALDWIKPGSAALHKHRFLERVRADVVTGRQHGVKGTPTFFVNDHLEDGNDDLQVLTVSLAQLQNCSDW